MEDLKKKVEELAAAVKVNEELIKILKDRVLIIENFLEVDSSDSSPDLGCYDWDPSQKLDYDEPRDWMHSGNEKVVKRKKK